MIGALAGLGILGSEVAWQASGRGNTAFFGDYWAILGGAALTVSHLLLLLGVSAHLYGVGRGYRIAGPVYRRHREKLSVEWMLGVGAALLALGLLVLGAVAAYWWSNQMQRFGGVLPAVIGTTLAALGVQNALGGFLLALIGDDLEIGEPQATEPRAERVKMIPLNATTP
jgi:hypothetical protein